MTRSAGAGLGAALERLRETLGPRLVAETVLPAEAETTAAPDPPLSPAIANALAARGVERLWSHQVDALAAARRGEDVLLTTATASGKSLVFQLPVLEEALDDGPGRALWLFPLKALGQDQRAKFRSLAEACGLDDERAGCEIYDGDTPATRRAALRRKAPRVLISNPDMVHLGMLPHAASWSALLGDLRWVVLDELHAYRGLFGCHLHHVLARLDRLARAAGARPAYVAASATAAAADEFAEALAGRPFTWIERSGAPRAARHLWLVRPTASPYTTALDLFATLVRSGLKTIAFTKARRITELLWTWLERRAPDVADRTRSYRAGYLPEERREIEASLHDGRLDGVLSTSALELGIDIGGLDACILVGYPGSAMSTWQRAGRVGRDGRESLIVLVALPDALDQYLVDHPRELVDRPLERLVLDPENEVVARQHLVCAAAEMPLEPASDGPYLERFAPAVGELLAEGKLARSAERDEIVALAKRPQREVSLRGTGGDFAIFDVERGAIIGRVDGSRVYAECHPGAIYLHAGRQYAIESLDLERRMARAVPTDVDWYTSPRSEKETEILERLGAAESGSLDAGFGRLRVTERVTGFERRRTHLFEAIDVQELDLPPVVYETQGLWFRAPAGSERDFAAAGRNLLGALHAVEHAAIGLFPLVALCDRNDLGGISLTGHPQLASPGVFVYEGHVGGVGIAKRGFAELATLLDRVRDHLRACPCDDGCPSCIHSPKCGNGNRPLDKAGAIAVLDRLLEDPQPVRFGSSPLPAPPAPAGRPASEQVELERRERLDVPELISLKGGPGLTEEPEPPTSPGRRFRGTAQDAPATVARPRGSEAADSHPSEEAVPDAGFSPDRPAGEAAAAGETGKKKEKGSKSSERSGNTVLFDLETLRSADEVGGWGRAHRMGIAVGVVLHLEEGRFEVYREPEVPQLVDDLKAARLVVGFNSLRFDYAVLSGYTGEDFRRLLPSLDLLESLRRRLGFRVGLDHVARETLGRGKSGDGLQSLEWVREGRLDLVERYCRDDVEILRDVYLHGRREGHVIVKTKSGRIRVPVDW